MDLIYKRTTWTLDGKPVLQQMERHGRDEKLYSLRFTAVWAVSLNAARAIQRQYRNAYPNTQTLK